MLGTVLRDGVALRHQYFCNAIFVRHCIAGVHSVSIDKVSVSPLYVDHEPQAKDRIYIAMSGGVDSSMAAALLKQKGYDLHGIFMRNWTDDLANTPCRSETDWKDVQDVCRHLSIPCERIDLSREYWGEVFQPALEVYAAGETPNPDVACNREIKFGKLFERLQARHTSRNWWLATGHYARSATSTITGKAVLLRSRDSNKDQTFYLSQVPQRALARTVFPLAHFTKPEIRQAAKSCLPRQIAEKPDSQGLCFVEPSQKGHFSAFLQEYLPVPEPAVVRLENGELVGTHSGIWHVTIGERSRLNFKKSQKLHPGGHWYVAAKSNSPPSYTIVPGRNHPMLYSRALIAKNWRWIDEDETYEGGGLVAQIRHREAPVICTVERLGKDRVKVKFDIEGGVYAATPGQAVAVWLDERCLGGGTIEKVE